jgi:vacuolar-type H+-ATPase subunit I/STV1
MSSVLKKVMTMGDKTESNSQAVDDSRLLPLESLSAKAIKKDLRLKAVQHPATILPLTSCALAIIYFVLLSPVYGWTIASFILIICSGIVAIGSFFYHHSIRYTKAYARRLQEVIELQERELEDTKEAELRQLLETLESGFKDSNSAEGLKALKDLVSEHEQLLPVFDQKKETEPLSLSHIPALAEETYRRGLSVLADVLDLEQVTHSSEKERLKREIEELERKIASLRTDETQAERVTIKESTIASHRERLDMIREHQLRADKLLYQCDRCEASLHLTRMEIVALKVESSQTSVSAVIETLQKTIDQAKEVQEELRRLGF